MTPRLRKLLFTAHLAMSIGWFGSACSFLALSVAGLASQDTALVRGAYLSMDLISRFVIIPMSLATLASGLGLALGTRWGLFRYYWVLASFGLTILAIAILLAHQVSAIAVAARLVTDSSVPIPWAELGRKGFVLLRASGLGVLVLLFVAGISVFKPWGLTPLARRPSRDWVSTLSEAGPRWRWAIWSALAAAGAGAIGLVAAHIASHGEHVARHGR